MNNGLTAERMMDSFPLALQKDPKMVALAHSIANVLEQRLDEINLGQIYTRIDQLPEDLLISEAPFWNDGQRQFIREEWREDADWAIVVDELNEALHADAVAARTAAG